MFAVSVELVIGALIAVVNALRMGRVRWLVTAILPAVACYFFIQAYRLVRKQLYRQTERARWRARLHCPQYRVHPAGLRIERGRGS